MGITPVCPCRPASRSEEAEAKQALWKLQPVFLEGTGYPPHSSTELRPITGLVSEPGQQRKFGDYGYEGHDSKGKLATDFVIVGIPLTENPDLVPPPIY